VPFVTDNLRLKELSQIVAVNKAFFYEFEGFLKNAGYESVFDFVQEKSDAKAIALIQAYFKTKFKADLLDGIGRPYAQSKAKWLFLGWLFRDAPSQRLQPLVSSIDGKTLVDRQSYLINEVRKFSAPLFPATEQWGWPVVSEVMLARLEGSRRAAKGTSFEEIVRTGLRTLFEQEGLDLVVEKKQIKLNEETYDIRVTSGDKAILMPVKTRETMGGGHALLFTRDIHKAIEAAQQHGYDCIPVVIAEEWGGDLEALASKHHIYIQVNPNQTDLIAPLLEAAIKNLLPTFREFASQKTAKDTQH